MSLLKLQYKVLNARLSSMFSHTDKGIVNKFMASVCFEQIGIWTQFACLDGCCHFSLKG